MERPIQQYRTALHHLNLALDVMIEQGDALMIANIAHPIFLCEAAILERQRLIVVEHRAVPADYG